MIKTLLRFGQVLIATLTLMGGGAWAVVDGISGTGSNPSFNLTAKSDTITAPDGGSLLAWGYASDDQGSFPGMMQYPGPTLIVNQGDTVTINLKNTLPMPVSMVFPGQQGVTPTCTLAASCQDGLLAMEVKSGTTLAPTGSVSYSFVASQPGTYLYHSGTRPDLQVEMGLVGAIIVRPAGFNEASSRTAYGHPDSAFDRENLFLLTEIDPKVHELVADGRWAEVDSSTFYPVYWFINGRAAPDTMIGAGTQTPWLPTQPYNALPRMHPGEKLLMRVIGAGRDLHPFHHHGNNTRTIARDGRLLESAPGAGPDLAVSDFTIKTVPGATYDAIFEWTGKGLGWDIYGTTAINPHTCTPDANGFDPATREWCADHDKALPVLLPNQLDLTNGAYWSGSPYLGMLGNVPPGSDGGNVNAGYFHMWHSHTEKEIVNFDLFPGGMMTMLIIEPTSVTIP